jgi:hypothetical protein
MPVAPALRFLAKGISEAAQIGDGFWRERRADDPAIAFCVIDEFPTSRPYWGWAGTQRVTSGRALKAAAHRKASGRTLSARLPSDLRLAVVMRVGTRGLSGVRPVGMRLIAGGP